MGLNVENKVTVTLTLNKQAKEGVFKHFTKLRELFGPNGENWITGTEFEENTDEEGNVTSTSYCLIGGIHEVNGKWESLAQEILAYAITQVRGEDFDMMSTEDIEEIFSDQDTITDFNDDEEGKKGWKRIVKALDLAEQMVRDAAAR